jgi:class 3 adenylate cyclase
MTCSGRHGRPLRADDPKVEGKILYPSQFAATTNNAGQAIPPYIYEGLHATRLCPWNAGCMVRPTRAVTFLFSDIEGSTRLWQQNETAMRAALSRHDEILRAAVARNDGSVFSAMGDGIAAAFASASAAAMAAQVLQRDLAAEPWPTDTPIRVRIGIHSGEAEFRDEDYFGTAVNRTARLMAIGHGGNPHVRRHGRTHWRK